MGSALYQRIRASGKIKYGFCYGKTYREAKEKVNKCFRIKYRRSSVRCFFGLAFVKE